ncbi:hypothetical protein EDD15DRAFT_2162667 [Pisolithus albus]|nr:hypothetical protein EDD15DRAFT_2162667 [Pisolithus albus]
MTGAYAFTDYRSQGQTLSSVIVDIATPPTGGLNLFNLYVALSRSRGRTHMRILRDFDEGIFLKPHCAELLMEDDRLEEENRRTVLWWNEIKSGEGKYRRYTCPKDNLTRHSSIVTMYSADIQTLRARVRSHMM